MHCKQQYLEKQNVSSEQIFIPGPSQIFHLQRKTGTHMEQQLEANSVNTVPCDLFLDQCYAHFMTENN